MMMRLTPKALDRRRYLFITEQQLDASMESALERLAPMVARHLGQRA